MIEQQFLRTSSELPVNFLRGVVCVQVVEDSPSDPFWGDGPDGRGTNHLGHILERVRSELAAADGSQLQTAQHSDGLQRAAGEPSNLC